MDDRSDYYPSKKVSEIKSVSENSIAFNENGLGGADVRRLEMAKTLPLRKGSLMLNFERIIDLKMVKNSL